MVIDGTEAVFIAKMESSQTVPLGVGRRFLIAGQLHRRGQDASLG
jgi:uncharacterized UPF0146 family protein